MPLTRAAPALVVAATLLAAGAARADEKAACVAAADQGQVMRDQHRLVEAHDQFVACGRDACPALVRKQCMEWLGQVDAGLPSVVLVATLGAQEVTDVRVFVDGRPFVERLGADAIPIDPGMHTFRFERPGSAPVETQALVHEGEKFKRISAALAPAPAPAPAPTPTPAPAPAPAPASAPTPDALDSRTTPAIDISVLLGGRMPSAFADAATMGPLLAGTLEVAWRPLRAFDFAVFGDAAGGPLMLDAPAATNAVVNRQAAYGNGTLGVRVRWYAVQLGVDTLWLAVDIGGMGETWQFSGTSSNHDHDFNYGTTLLGAGAMVGVDFPIQSPWALGVVARGSAFFGPHGKRTGCGASADCTGEAPGGSIDQHAFVDVGLRLRVSLDTR